MLSSSDLRSFQSGDPEAMRAVYRAYGRLVHSVCVRVLGSRELAEDATQQTFLKAWRAAATVDLEREIAPWLATIARRTALDLAMRETRRRTTPLEQVAPSDPSLSHEPVGDDRTWDAWQVRAAVDELPAEERDVVRLQHLEQLTHAEVANRLGIPIGTVKSRSSRAHKHLAARLGHLKDQADSG